MSWLSNDYHYTPTPLIYEYISGSDTPKLVNSFRFLTKPNPTENKTQPIPIPKRKESSWDITPSHPSYITWSMLSEGRKTNFTGASLMELIPVL